MKYIIILWLTCITQIITKAKINSLEFILRLNQYISPFTHEPKGLLYQTMKDEIFELNLDSQKKVLTITFDNPEDSITKEPLSFFDDHKLDSAKNKLSIPFKLSLCIDYKFASWVIKCIYFDSKGRVFEFLFSYNQTDMPNAYSDVIGEFRKGLTTVQDDLFRRTAAMASTLGMPDIYFFLEVYFHLKLNKSFANGELNKLNDFLEKIGNINQLIQLVQNSPDQQYIEQRKAVLKRSRETITEYFDIKNMKTKMKKIIGLKKQKKGYLPELTDFSNDVIENFNKRVTNYYNHPLLNTYYYQEKIITLWAQAFTRLLFSGKSKYYYGDFLEFTRSSLLNTFGFSSQDERKFLKDIIEKGLTENRPWEQYQIKTVENFDYLLLRNLLMFKMIINGYIHVELNVIVNNHITDEHMKYILKKKKAI
jgi:hypothetical protein